MDVLRILISGRSFFFDTEKRLFPKDKNDRATSTCKFEEVYKWHIFKTSIQSIIGFNPDIISGLREEVSS